MRFRILGPLQVLGEAGELELGVGRQRVVLAMLLLEANRVVPVSRLVEALWGDFPPGTPRNQIQIRISQLRRTLNDTAQPYQMVITRPSGYLIRVAPMDLDLTAFEHLVTKAQTLHREEAARTLREALKLWRAPALSDVDSDLVRSIAHGLEERRLLAFERCVELELELGNHLRLIEELRAVTKAQPLRERPHGHLMLALYGAGRQAEALEVFRGYRMFLLDMLGLEPSEELRWIERCILNHDPAIDPRPAKDKGLPPSASQEAGAARRATSPAGEGPRREGSDHGGPLTPPADAHERHTREGSERKPPRREHSGLEDSRREDSRREGPEGEGAGQEGAESSRRGGVSRPVPRQLPPVLSRLSGREAELARIEELLTERRGTTLPVVAVLGKAGVGKSELALHAAHRLADAYPDGQLYVDLQSGALRPQDALARFLRALGLPSVPRTLEERSALFRSTVAERRVLVLLDDAESIQQTEPLLPGGASCAVLVTSRRNLVGLPERQVIRLGLLDGADAAELLIQDLGVQRATADPEAIRLLVKQCGGLPLALRIAGTSLGTWPHSAVQDLVMTIGDLDVKAVLDVGYRALSPQAQTLFRRLGLVGGPQITAWLAHALISTPSKHPGPALAAAAGDRPALPAPHPRLKLTSAPPQAPEIPPTRRTPARSEPTTPHTADHPEPTTPPGHRSTRPVPCDTHEGVDPVTPACVRTAEPTSLGLLMSGASAQAEVVERAFEELVDTALLRRRGGHYVWHDLVRIFAAERAFAEDTQEARTAVLKHAGATLLALVEQAHRRHYGGHFTVLRGLVDLPEIDGSQMFGDEPLGWLDAELPVLIRAVQQAADHGLAELAWSLAMTAVTLFETYGYFDDWRAVSEVALAACLSAGNARGEGAMLFSLSSLAIFQQRYDDACPLVSAALAIFEKIGEDHGRALALRNAALLDRAGGDLDGALQRYAEALGLLRAVGDRAAEAYVLSNMALIHGECGRLDEADPLLRQALAIYTQEGVRRGEAQALMRLAELSLRRGRSEPALQAYGKARTIVREAHDRIGEAYVLQGLGEAHLKLGRAGDAERTLREALDIAAEVGDRLIQGRARLALGTLLLESGRPGAAVELERAQALFAEINAEPLRAQAAEALTRIHQTTP